MLLLQISIKSNPDWNILSACFVIGIILIVFATPIFEFFQNKTDNKYYAKTKKRQPSPLPLTPKIEEPNTSKKVQEKNYYISKIPIFLYVDNEMIDSIYDEINYDKWNLKKETTSIEVVGGIKTPPLQLEVSRKKTNDLTQKDASLIEKYVTSLMHCNNTDRLITNLNELVIEGVELTRFDQTIATANNFNLTLNREEVSKKRQELQLKITKELFDKWHESTESFCLMYQNQFDIKQDADENFVLESPHPISKQLGADIKMRVIPLLNNLFRERGKASFKKNLHRTMPLTVFGSMKRVMDNKSNTWEIQIMPFAISSI